MITVKFYSFAKRLNSTKQPTGSGTDISCLVKSDSSIVNPVIELSTDPTGYNYCYIASFSRYYYIDDIVFVKGIWNVYCHVDVLASYKTTIGSTSGYCTRASAMYDGTLQDDAWPVSTDYDYKVVTSPSQYSWYGFSQGYYVLGVKGKTSGSINGVIYYLLTPAQFTQVIDAFYTNSGSATYFGNLAKGVIDSIYNLSDFIASCRWYPVLLNSSSTSQRIYLGAFDTGVDAPVCVEYPASVFPFGFTSIPKHPEATGRGAYMNAAPYTKYEIHTPWGLTIPLDSYFMRDRTNLTMHLVMDFTTGQAALRIKDGVTPEGALTPISYDRFTTYIDFGVEVPLTGTNVSVGGFIGNAVKGLANFAFGNTLGAASAVGNALLNSVPDPSPVPSRGGYVGVDGTQPYLACYFYKPANVDYIHHGRPYCRNVSPSFLGSGYMQYETYSVAITGTSEEAGSINSYMMSGIYYE